MGHRGKLVDSWEWDCFSPYRKYITLKTKYIKRKYSKRQRHIAKKELKNEDY